MDVGGVGGGEELPPPELTRCAVWPGYGRTPGSRVRPVRVHLAIDRLDVLPDWEGRLNALACPWRGAGIEIDRLGPPLQLRGRNDDFGVREHLSIGVLGHQARNVIAVEMRNEDRLDGLGIETGRGHALRQQAGFRTARLPAAGAGFDQDEVAPVLTAMIVNGMDTWASVCPPALSAAFVSSTLTPLMKF